MRVWISLVVALSLSALSLQAAENPINGEIRQQFYQVTNDIRRAVDRMPESNFDFKPTPKMRSFRELVEHVAEFQNSVCSAVFQDRKANFASPKSMSKADLAAALGNSFTACYQAFADLSPENAAVKVSTPMGSQT